jgi:hypothetical protein
MSETEAKQAPVMPHGASTEEAAQLAAEVQRKFVEQHHPPRVAIRVPTWNGRPVMPIEPSPNN